MSRWLRLQQLQGPLLDQLKRLYGPHFPIEVRHYIAGWLESQSWNDFDPDNQYQSQLCYEGLLRALEEVLSEHNGDFLVRTQLEGLFLHMRVSYSNKQTELVKNIQECIRKEIQLLETMESDMHKSPQEPSGPEQQIQMKLDLCKQHTEDMARIQKQLHSFNENLNLRHGEFMRVQNSWQERPNMDKNDQLRFKQQLEANLRKEMMEYHQRQKDAEAKFRDVLKEIDLVQQQVLDEMLEDWKQKQKSYNTDDARQTKQLNQIQKWCEMLAEMIWLLYQLLKQDDFHQHLPWNQSGQNGPTSHTSVLQQLQRYVIGLLVNLVKKSFILERQPPQVLKTANRFTATLRILVGSKLNIHMSPPEVTASIINEQQAQQVQNEPDKKFEPSFNMGEILYNRKLMEIQQTDRLTCVFNNMQLKRIKRGQDRKHESVMEEKFTLFFQSILHIGEGLNVVVGAMSLPAVVIVHGNQQPQAEYTIFWDNSFSEPNRQPFKTTDVVPWSQLGEALNNYFFQATGRGLTPHNLNFLARKLVPNIGPDEDVASVKVTRQAVGKENMRGSQFTFWSWFYQARELIVNCLKKEWCAGLIEGFIDKNTAIMKLEKKQSGTFLVRFSEHCCGGVSIAYTKGDMFTPTEVLNVQPWTKNELQNIYPFSNRVRDLAELIYLYPNTPKGEAFAEFYQQHQQSTTVDNLGYIPASIVAVLPSSSSPSVAGSMYSPAQSPYSQQLGSPFSNPPSTPLDPCIPSDILPHPPGSSSTFLQPFQDAFS